jgi:hypothetical protein
MLFELFCNNELNPMSAEILWTLFAVSAAEIDQQTFMTFFHTSWECRRILNKLLRTRKRQDPVKRLEKCSHCEKNFSYHYSIVDFLDEDWIFLDYTTLYYSVFNPNFCDVFVNALRKSYWSSPKIANFIVKFAPTDETIKIMSTILDLTGQVTPSSLWNKQRKIKFHQWRRIVRQNGHPKWQRLILYRNLAEIQEVIQMGNWPAKSPPDKRPIPPLTLTLRSSKRVKLSN